MSDFPVDDEVHAEAEAVDGLEGFDEGGYVSITVRSLSGAEINFPQLSLSLPVRELKCLIFEQNEKFPVATQKLIKGSKTLEDHKTLGDYGVKNGDTLHLVKRLDDFDADASEEAGPVVRVTSSSSSNTITVVVPDGARPGTRLLINPPGREQMAVTVPAGVRAGDRFQVRLPEPGSSSGGGGGGGGSSSAQGGQIMQVQCPMNAHGGQQILIEVPGRGRMRVQVPRGVKPGDTFRFRVPT